MAGTGAGAGTPAPSGIHGRSGAAGAEGAFPWCAHPVDTQSAAIRRTRGFTAGIIRRAASRRFDLRSRSKEDLVRRLMTEPLHRPALDRVDRKAAITEC